MSLSVGNGSPNDTSIPRPAAARLTGSQPTGEVRSLLDWLVDPWPSGGVRVADAAVQEWSFTSFPELAVQVRRAAAHLRDCGVEPGEVVPIVRSNSVSFIADLFGILAIGATPAPVAPPKAFRQEAPYLRHLLRVLTMTGARHLTTTDPLAARLRPTAEQVGCRIITDVAGDAPLLSRAATLPRIALIQMSSGSTGPHKGIQLSTSALERHVDAIGDWLDVTADDSIAVWAPTHHDMGLIGCVVASVVHGCDVWLMEPEQYVRWPVRWLQRFSTPGATIAATTSAALAYLCKRVRPHELEGMDFSGVRSVIVGAERIDPRVLDDFLALLGPFGLRPEALRPAYGMAEATLTVTGVPLGATVRRLAVDTGSLTAGNRVTIDPPGADALIAGCGRPVAGVEVSIVDSDGRVCVEDTIGEIEVRSRSLASGYLSDDGGRGFGESLRTGDAGFIHDGELYVLGRIGDSVKQLGTWLFAEDFDQAAGAISPWPHRTVALLGNLAGRDSAVVVIEGNLGEAAERVGQAVRRQAGDLRVVVVSCPAGTIRRTTSGKPMRRAIWEALTADWDDGMVRWSSDAIGS